MWYISFDLWPCSYKVYVYLHAFESHKCKLTWLSIWTNDLKYISSLKLLAVIIRKVHKEKNDWARHWVD